MKFKKEFYVLIKSCSKETSWYADKIGTVHQVTDELFPPDFTVINRNKNKRGLYPTIVLGDAETVTQSLGERFLRFLKIK